VSNKEDGCGATAFMLVLAIPLCLYGAFADGYVLAHLWAWFAVPQGSRSLPWQTFAAAAMAYTIFTLKIQGAQPEDKRARLEKAHATLLFIAAPWLMLLVGWLIK